MTIVSRGTARYTLFALFMSMVIAFIDRNILNLLVDPIRQDTGLSDSQISILQGPAFLIVYMLVMFPVAWMSDYVSRKLVIIVSLIMFSIMTCVFGLVEGFLLLLLARAAVAMGEAGVGPTAIALIRESNPPEKQALAISILGTSAYAGGGLALIFGGIGYKAIYAHTGDSSAWRWLFVICGLLGIIAVILVSFLKETPHTEKSRDESSMKDFFRHIRSNFQLVASFLSAFVFLAGTSLGVVSWFPAMLTRSGWSVENAGIVFGLASLAGGILGAVGSGYLVGRLIKRTISYAPVRVLMGAAALLGVATVIAVTAITANIAAIVIISSVLIMLAVGAISAQGAYGFQSFFPPQFSARAVAFYMVVPGAFGAAAGPVIIPTVMNFTNGNLAEAILIVGTTGSILAFLCLATTFWSFKPPTVAANVK